ncbi:hypothetical protein [uncultured Ruegeria sp.]|uniref:hypothetical protein n=1 Tax=uncultured Ruegeria sp. TaxID=259304 RepID=UPI00260552F8|nr:hypothetical protein [uncultured Ruegeria sp.]
MVYLFHNHELFFTLLNLFFKDFLSKMSIRRDFPAISFRCHFEPFGITELSLSVERALLKPNQNLTPISIPVIVVTIRQNALHQMFHPLPERITSNSRSDIRGLDQASDDAFGDLEAENSAATVCSREQQVKPIRRFSKDLL